METDAPATIFKRSKTRTARTRAVSPTIDTSTNGEASASPSTLATKLKKQHKERAKPKARLSFGGEEEEGDGETFQVKKSNLSRKLKLGTSSGVILPDNLDQASIAPPSSSVVYSKEYLTELKASTSSAPSADRPPNTSYDSDMVLDPSEISGAIIVDEEITADIPTEIPAESSVLAAKQRRERLRQNKSYGQDEDGFISLSVSRKEDLYQGPHPESRLMREDDDLGEGDDDFAEYTAAHERIALGKKGKKKEAASRRTAMQEMINDAEEQDDETMEWEKEQLRRGSRRSSEPTEAPKAKQEYRPAPIPPSTPLPSLDAAITRLSYSLTQLTTSHTSSTSSMSTLADERTVLEGKEKEMRTMVEKSEKKRSWFSSFREWVETVATFLDEKYPGLEKLEEEHISLLRERYDMTLKRRIQDDEDDLTLFLGALAPVLDEGPEEIDELGRVVPRQNFTVARRERRAARTSRHSRHKISSQEEEGYSTDSTLPPSDESDYKTALSNLQIKVASLLQDVQSDEFRDPRIGIARWFGIWRKSYSDTYSGAFGGLGMVSAWEFWARLEILGWDPVADPRALDSFDWFSALYDYSRPLIPDSDAMDEDGDNEPQFGPDGDLASAMLSTIVPRFCKIIQEGAFDPYSARHIRAMIDLAEQVEAYASKDKFELLQKSVIATFRQTIESNTNILQPYLERDNTANFDPEAIPARRRFLIRRYKLIGNFLRWRKYTGERYGVGEMVRKLVTECIRPVAETGWEVGGEELFQKVMRIIPSELRNTITTE